MPCIKRVIVFMVVFVFVFVFVLMSLCLCVCIPLHALHQKGLQRQKGVGPLVSSQERRVSRFWNRQVLYLPYCCASLSLALTICVTNTHANNSAIVVSSIVVDTVITVVVIIFVIISSSIVISLV